MRGWARLLTVVVCGAVFLLMTAIPGVTDPGTPNEGNSGLKIIEEAGGEFTDHCPDGTELQAVWSGYYMSRWDTLTGQVFAVENVHIDWVFSNPDGEVWTYSERGVSVVREGEDILVVSNNGQHNHWLFGAHTGHRIFTASAEGGHHLEEILEAGIALGTVFEEACGQLSG